MAEVLVVGSGRLFMNEEPRCFITLVTPSENASSVRLTRQQEKNEIIPATVKA